MEEKNEFVEETTDAQTAEGLPDGDLEGVSGGYDGFDPWYCRFFPRGGSPLRRDCLHCAHYDRTKVCGCTLAPQTRS